MERMIVDLSSVLWMALLTGKDAEYGRVVEFKDKKVHVNGWQFGYEVTMNHMTSVMRDLELSPSQLIIVPEGKLSKSRRRAIYNDYKEERDSRPPEAYVEFGICRDKLLDDFRSAGAWAVMQDGVEGDDVIGYLARTLPGIKIIRSNDGDMTTLLDDPSVFLYTSAKGLTQENKYGPFPPRYVPVYKALVGDGEEYKGASKFGPKSFLDFLVWGGDAGLPAIEGVIQRRQLHELECDVAEFKPMRKIIDSAKHVYESYECALLHDEWINTERCPLVVYPPTNGTAESGAFDLGAIINPVKPETPKAEKVDKVHVVFDCELIGTDLPVFLVCTHILETGERASFWWHKQGNMGALQDMVDRPDLTWVSFNGIHFDAPIISAALAGKDPMVLKVMANAIINDDAKSWQMPSQYGYDPIEIDHIDLIEVAPGVRTSLKVYAGRMGYPTMVDLPFDHDKDLSREECDELETYCQNDLGVTEWLFKRLESDINLRIKMSEEHGIDLRSKSDAQVAEAVLKKAANIKGRGGKVPRSVGYTAPSFIETDNGIIEELVDRMNTTDFSINPANGQVVAPDYLAEPIELCSGTYQVGVGGLHSTHDKRLFLEADDEMLLSDFDVASYYPNIMLKAGLTPRIDGGGGDRFIAEYKNIYDRRIEAKHSGNKKVADALKISLNGTFGKLGSPYSAFYSPDLMLAVTLTGQLNLMCLIHDLECRPSIRVCSANTDGILVQYRAKDREKVLSVIADNARRTGFEYEETRYLKVAMKDVNNYIAIVADYSDPTNPVIAKDKDGNDEVKRKGLYASISLMKNPTMGVCSNMAVDYLKTGILPADSIKNYTDIREFVAIRAVKGGGIQYESTVEVDDWVCVKDLNSKENEWRRPCWEEGKVLKRKSRPKPAEVGVGGKPFGRIARWYMSKSSTSPLSYCGSGNKVPKTDRARLCMTLPENLPDDIDRDWYVQETLNILADIGVEVVNVTELMAEIVAKHVDVYSV